MEKTLTKKQRDLLAPVLQFASMWKSGKTAIESVAQVQDLVFTAAVAMDTQLFLVIPDSDKSVAEFRDYQRVLRGWLHELMRVDELSETKRTELLTGIASWADEAHVLMRTVIQDGELRRVAQLQSTGVQAVVGEALSRLLSFDTLGVQSVVGVCKHCGDYFVKARKDKLTCSPSCRVLANRPTKGKGRKK